MSFTISGVSLTLDDATAGQDPYVNVVTVNAQDDEGTAATDDDTATINVTGATPTITIVKDVDANKDGLMSRQELEQYATGGGSVQNRYTVALHVSEWIRRVHAAPRGPGKAEAASAQRLEAAGRSPPAPSAGRHERRPAPIRLQDCRIDAIRRAGRSSAPG